jgi:hypothetical protein
MPKGTAIGSALDFPCAMTSAVDTSTMAVRRRGCTNARNVARMIDGSGWDSYPKRRMSNWPKCPSSIAPGAWSYTAAPAPSGALLTLLRWWRL